MLQQVQVLHLRGEGAQEQENRIRELAVKRDVGNPIHNT